MTFALVDALMGRTREKIVLVSYSTKVIAVRMLTIASSSVDHGLGRLL